MNTIIIVVLQLAMFLLFFADLIFIVYSLVNCIKTDETQIQHLPKFAWALIIIFGQFFLPIGAILWFTIGKAKGSKPKRANKRKVTGPDDDPDFLRGL